MTTLAVRLVGLHWETERIRRLELAPVTGSLPPFSAGAHLDLHLGGLIRPYSLCGDPADRDRYQIAVKREDASRGGSQRVHALALGEVLHVSPPRNAFALRPAARSLLVGAGIGITPLLSMASALAAKGADFELHHYARSAADAGFATWHTAPWLRERSWLHRSDAGASPRRHRPWEASLSADTHLYLCGPAPFMALLRERALQAGLPDDQVHQEAFGPSLAPVAASNDFEVELARSGRILPVPAERSIAAVLQEAGIAVLLSCEQGLCGACLTPVLAGTPDHRDEVLSTAERASGRVMALCCSRSQSPRLTLDL